MQTERQAILSLVALGRITARDAERLLAAWNSGREEIWVMGACAAACVAQSLPLARLVHTLLPGGFPGLFHSVSAITYRIGGLL